MYVSTNNLDSFSSSQAMRYTTRIGYGYSPCQAKQYLNFNVLTNYEVNADNAYDLWVKRGDWTVEQAKKKIMMISGITFEV